MKRFFACLFLLSVTGVNGAAEEPFTIAKNGYGDVVIKVHNLENWKDKSALLRKIKEQERSFFVELPLKQVGLLATSLIKKYGFSVYHTNNTRMHLVKSIGDYPIPPIVTGNNAVKVFISRRNCFNNKLQVLFTKEKGRLAASLPGGTVEYEEDICTAAVRELQEELSFKVGEDQLLFLGVLNRVKAFEYRVTHNEFLFHLPYDGKQKITADKKEVKGFVWKDVDDVIESEEVEGSLVLEHHLEALIRLSEGKYGRRWMRMPDYRQLNPRAKEDPNDTMIFCPAEESE